MTIVPYAPQYKQDFIALNSEWMEKMFGEVEAEDKYVFDHVEELIASGSQIYFALDEEGVMACCMVIDMGGNIFEVCKFAARGQYTGKGAGSACLKACLDYAKANGAQRIFVVSNTKCTHAIKLYKENGFKEAPFNKSHVSLKRANITFELYLG